MQYGYVIGNPVKIGVILPGLSKFMYRPYIPNSEIAGSYIKTGVVKLFANQKDAEIYARLNRDQNQGLVNDIITQSAFFYVEFENEVNMENMERKEEYYSVPAFGFLRRGRYECGGVHHFNISYLEADASNFTPILGQMYKGNDYIVNLTPDAKPQDTANSCVIS